MAPKATAVKDPGRGRDSPCRRPMTSESHRRFWYPGGYGADTPDRYVETVEISVPTSTIVLIPVPDWRRSRFLLPMSRLDRERFSQRTCRNGVTSYAVAHFSSGPADCPSLPREDAICGGRGGAITPTDRPLSLATSQGKALRWLVEEEPSEFPIQVHTLRRSNDTPSPCYAIPSTSRRSGGLVGAGRARRATIE